MEPEPPLLPGARDDPIWSEPESDLGTSGAAPKSGGSATLELRDNKGTDTKKSLLRFGEVFLLAGVRAAPKVRRRLHM